MVFITSFIGAAALLSGYVSALPRPDSAINEPAVSAPDGIPITASSSPVAQATSASGKSNYGSSGNSGSMNSVMSSATTTSSAWQSYSTPSYGSGSSNWGNQGYNDCVQRKSIWSPSQSLEIENYCRMRCFVWRSSCLLHPNCHQHGLWKPRLRCHAHCHCRSYARRPPLHSFRAERFRR